MVSHLEVGLTRRGGEMFAGGLPMPCKAPMPSFQPSVACGGSQVSPAFRGPPNVSHSVLVPHRCSQNACRPPFLTLPSFLLSIVLVPGGLRVSKLRGKLRQDVGPEREEENVQAVPFSQGRCHLPRGEADALSEERDVQVPDQRGCSRLHGGSHRVPGR